MEKNKLLNFYLGVVSIFSILAIAINLGIVLTMFGRFFIISDAEYIASRYSYRLDNCETSDIVKTTVVGEEVASEIKKSEDEIEQCKEEVKQELITQRRFNLKEDLITAGAWFIVFLFLFLFHYPKFKGFNIEEEKAATKRKTTAKK